MMKEFLLLFFILNSIFTFSQEPTGYYDGTDNLSGKELKLKLHQIIRDHTVRTYAEFRDVILPDLDEDPNNSANIILFYKNNSINKQDFADGNDAWNREHTWPSSHGFGNDADTAYTDVHNLRPSDVSVNTSKSNKDFNDVEHIAENEEGDAPNTYITADFFEPRDEIKGDVARILFYMDTRYESARLNLELQDRSTFSNDPEFGVLYTLIKWHELDPVDDAERARHEGAYGYQGNRNPFVDHPEWVSEIFGSTTSPTLISDQLNFSEDFGVVALGESKDQVYKLNAYNLIDDVSIEVNSPFWVSTDQITWLDSIGYENDGTGSQIFDVFIRYQPDVMDEIATSTVIQYTDGDTIEFDVTGQEGTVSVMSIAEARTKSLGESVFVSGVVIDKGNNSANSRVIYDGTAGIVVRSFDAGNESSVLVFGDSVSVTGTLGEYNSLLQISESPITITLEKQNVSIPEPQELLLSEIGEEHESELVLVKNVSFVTQGSFAGGGSSGNFTITDGTTNFIVRIGSSGHPLVGESVPSENVDIVGYIGQFGTDYQISPRDAEDITILGGNTPPLGIGETDQLKVYPNPSTYFIRIESHVGTYFQLITQEGKLLRTIENKGDKIYVGDLQSGNYLLVSEDNTFFRLVID